MRGFPLNTHLFLLKPHSFKHTRSFRNTIRASRGLSFGWYRSFVGIKSVQKAGEARTGPGSYKENKMGAG